MAEGERPKRETAARIRSRARRTPRASRAPRPGSASSTTPATSRWAGRASTAARAPTSCGRPSSTRRWCAPARRSLIGMMGIQMVGPDAHRARHRGAAATLPAEDPHRRRDLVPGLLRAGLRLRPGVAAHPRRARRRRLRRERPEDLDLGRAVRRLDVLPRAHRSRGAEAPRHLVHPDRHEDARASRCARSCR